MPDEAIGLRLMTPADFPLGMRLKEIAGWNQTQADWMRMLTLAGDGGFVAEYAGRPVGTAFACRFDRVGWIATVLVDPEHRRRGIGTRLVERAIAHLEQRGAISIRLDATPIGRPLYERLGFRLEYELARWEGAPARRPASAVAQVGAGQLGAIEDLDRQVTGTSREGLLRWLFQQQSGAMRGVWKGDSLLGYATWRAGSRAAMLGPAIALEPEPGQALMDAVLADRAGRPVYVDIPRDNEAAVRWAQSHGLVVQRPLFRMVRGQPVSDRPQCIWASSGPECG